MSKHAQAAAAATAKRKTHTHIATHTNFSILFFCVLSSTRTRKAEENTKSINFTFPMA